MQAEADKKLIAAMRTLHAALPYAGDRQVLQLGIDRLEELFRVQNALDDHLRVDFKQT